MEIERKFLLKSFPEGFKLIETSVVRQAFLSVDPYVRIREKNGSSYKITVKGEGGLSREEVELDIDAEIYERLKVLCKGEEIEKIYRAYRLDDGHIFECSLVDGDFYYGEVEFESEKEALDFVPPFEFIRETTYEKGFSMDEYWKRTRIEKGKFQT